MHLNRFTLFATGLCFLAASCKKDDAATTSADTDTGHAADYASLETSFNDAQSIADVAASNNSLAGYLRTTGEPTPLSGCATVAHDTTSSPRTLVVDFGAANCLCGDGNYRRGKIICSYTGRYKDAGSVHTITFDNYFRNDNQLTGLRTVTNMGVNSQSQVYYTVADQTAIILANDAGTRSWNSVRTRTWVAGYNTPTWQDDAYQIAGSGTVTRVNGRTFDIDIAAPLEVALDCKWIKAGVLTITPQGGNVRTLNYGTGTCDALAEMTINGTTHNVSLN